MGCKQTKSPPKYSKLEGAEFKQIRKIESLFVSRSLTDTDIEASFECLRNTGYFLYTAPGVISSNRAFSIIISFLNAFDPARGNVYAEYDPLLHKLMWTPTDPTSWKTRAIARSLWKSIESPMVYSPLGVMLAANSETDIAVKVSFGTATALATQIAINCDRYETFALVVRNSHLRVVFDKDMKECPVFDTGGKQNLCIA